MSNEHRAAITKLAGEDLYASIERHQAQMRSYATKIDVLQAEHDRLQAQVSGLKANAAMDETTRLGYRDELDTCRIHLGKHATAYALLKAAIDKKAVARTKKGFVRDVEAAYADAEKVMGAK